MNEQTWSFPDLSLKHTVKDLVELIEARDICKSKNLSVSKVYPRVTAKKPVELLKTFEELGVVEGHLFRIDFESKDQDKAKEEQIAEVKNNFDFFDRDGNGEIDVDEFEKLLQVLSPDATAEQAKRGFAIIDENDDGHIDFDEFLEWWQTCWWEF